MVESPKHALIRVGVEISKDSLTAVAIDPEDQVLHATSLSLSSSSDAIKELADTVTKLRSSVGDFDKIGVAVPGLVERTSGRVAFSALVPGHSDVNLADAIAGETGLSVVLENDANAAAYGEFRCGAGRGSTDMFYATLGEGVGGAFIFGGEIWHGVSGFAGELGYVPINSEGMRLEEVASSANIVRRTRSRFHQDSTSSLGKLKEEDLTLADIITAAQNEDDFAQMMLGRTGAYVGTAVAAVINLLNIERVVVGGSVMEAKRAVLNALIARVRELSFAPSFASTTIAAGELGSNAAAIGAACICEQ